MLFKKYVFNVCVLSFFLFFLPAFFYAGAPLDFDFANDPEFSKMMEEFERELANLSPEERQQFDEMVNEFQKVLEEMPEEEFEKLIEDINNDIAANGGIKPESGATPASEIMPAAPAFIEIPEEIKTLAEVIQAIKTNISMLLTKIHIAPEIAMKINKWMIQGKITGAPENYTWEQLNADLEKFVSLLANLLATNKKMKPIFLFSIHENKALEQALIQFSAEILEVSAIEIVEFGAKQTKYTNQLLINILSLFCELNFGKNVMTDLNTIYQKHITEVAGQKKDEKIPALPKENFSASPSGFSGGNFDQPSYGGGSDFFGNDSSYGGGYSDYGNYPSYGGGYDDYDYKEKGEKEGGKGGTGSGGGASGGKSAAPVKTEKKEEELKDKSPEIFKEIDSNKKDLQVALSKAVGTINSTELQECLPQGEDTEETEAPKKKPTSKTTEKETEKKEATEEKPQETQKEEKLPTSTEKVPLTEEQKKLIEELDEALSKTSYDIAEWTQELYEKFVNYIQELLKKLEPIAMIPEVQDKIMQLKEKLAKKFKEEKTEPKIEEKNEETTELNPSKKITTSGVVFIKVDTKEKFEKQLETVKSRAENLNKSVNKIKVKKKKEETAEKIAKEIEDDVMMLDALFEGLKNQQKNPTNTVLVDDLKDVLKSLDPFMTKKMKEDKKKKEDVEKKK